MVRLPAETAVLLHTGQAASLDGRHWEFAWNKWPHAKLIAGSLTNIYMQLAQQFT